MPKENKKARGRRDADKGKRKRAYEQYEEHPTKKQKSAAVVEDIQFLGTDNAVMDYEVQETNTIERPFFGLLNDEEQEYFRHADELLELNDFPSPEERELFLANVYREAEGKELKIANSQSCSRLMERLILLSTPDQKKKLFERFSGHFFHLVQHRFASHCCEMLFIQSAPIVTQELTEELPTKTEEASGIMNGDGVYVSMENLFLYTLDELEGHTGFLLTDKFGSHALRVLLLVLSGQSLAKSSTKSLLQSKRKEKIGITGLESSMTESSLDKRPVPESFQLAIDKILSNVVSGLDTSFIHVLATHPTGNPTLQVLLELELTRQGKKPNASTPKIIEQLLPDDLSAENSKSASFLNGLVYDPIGSRLLETIVTFAPGKLFKQIYRSMFKERMASLARNEIASFVVNKVLERLSRIDLDEAVTFMLPQIPTLIERRRTAVIKTLLQRCHIRAAEGSIERLTTAIDQAYGSDPSTLISKMTKSAPEALDVEPSPDTSNPIRLEPSTLHGSLLAQTMLSIPGPTTTLIQNSLLAQSPSTLIAFACTTATSHVLQSALTPTSTNLLFRRKLINLILAYQPPETNTEHNKNPILILATSKSGSHVLDALYSGTASLMMLKERICSTLLEHETILRNDFVGRVVWRNWMVDLFKRNRPEWVKRVRASEAEAEAQALKTVDAGFPNRNGNRGGEEGGDVEIKGKGKGNGGKRDKARLGKNGNGKGNVNVNGNWGSGKVAVNGSKTPIELARQKFAMGKARGKATGANAT